MEDKPYSYNGILFGYRPGRFLEVLHKIREGTANDIATAMGIENGGKAFGCTISVINYKCKEQGVPPPFKKRSVGGLGNSPSYIYTGDKAPSRLIPEDEFEYCRAKHDPYSPSTPTPVNNQENRAPKQKSSPQVIAGITGNRPGWNTKTRPNYNKRPSGNPGRKHHSWTNEDDDRLIQTKASLQIKSFDSDADLWIAVSKTLFGMFKIDVTPAAASSRHKRLMETRVLPGSSFSQKATSAVVNFDVDAKKLDSRDPIDKLVKLSDKVDHMRDELRHLTEKVNKLLDMWS
ncbi:MAG: hypothetical protein AABY46_08210 [Nitrospirota bacterium]